MTSADLSDLNGLVALEVAERGRAGDNRDPSMIANAVLAEASAPSLAGTLDRLYGMIGRRQQGNPPHRVLP